MTMLTPWQVYVRLDREVGRRLNKALEPFLVKASVGTSIDRREWAIEMTELVEGAMALPGTHFPCEEDQRLLGNISAAMSRYQEAVGRNNRAMNPLTPPKNWSDIAEQIASWMALRQARTDAARALSLLLDHRLGEEVTK